MIVWLLLRDVNNGNIGGKVRIERRLQASWSQGTLGREGHDLMQGMSTRVGSSGTDNGRPFPYNQGYRLFERRLHSHLSRLSLES
jgi:hypothetical protein